MLDSDTIATGFAATSSTSTPIVALQCMKDASRKRRNIDGDEDGDDEEYAEKGS